MGGADRGAGGRQPGLAAFRNHFADAVATGVQAHERIHAERVQHCRRVRRRSAEQFDLVAGNADFARALDAVVTRVFVDKARQLGRRQFTEVVLDAVGARDQRDGELRHVWRGGETLCNGRQRRERECGAHGLQRRDQSHQQNEAEGLVMQVS
mgnify:CR=1 FL=1